MKAYHQSAGKLGRIELSNGQKEAKKSQSPTTEGGNSRGRELLPLNPKDKKELHKEKKGGTKEDLTTKNEGNKYLYKEEHNLQLPNITDR